MADNDILLKLKLLDEYSAELKKFSAGLKGAEAQATGSGDKIADSFGGIKDAILEVGKIAGFTTLIAGLKNVMAAASAAEQSNAKLGAALKATGQYTDTAVAGLEEWSVAMMRAKGVDDELAKSLVADAVAKGKNIEQSKRLTEAAADMAPVVGSVEAAMGLLIRASNGSTEALKRYGIEVTEAEAKSGNFEAVLQRVEQQFSGQAAAQVETYAGQIKVLAGEFENLKETIGGPLIAAATDWLTMLNQLIAKHGELEAAMNASVAGASYRKLATQLSVIGTEKEALEKLVNGMSTEDSDYTTWAGKLADIKVKYNEILAAMNQVTSAAKKQGTSVTEAAASSKGAATMRNTKSGTSGTSTTKKLEESSEMDYKLAAKSAAYQELLKAEAHQSGQSGTASIAETVAEQAFDNSGLATVFKQSADSWQKQTAAAQNAGLKLSNLATVTGAAAVEMAVLGDAVERTTTPEGSDYDPEQALTDSIVESEEQIAAARKEATAEATVLIAESVEDMAYAIKNNDYGSAARSLGTALEAGFSSLKNAGEYGEIIGNVISSDSVTSALGSVVGGVIGAIYGGVGGAAAGSAAGGALGSLFQETANTAGSQLREKLYDALTDVGFDFDNGGESDASKWTKEALDSSGMAGFWDAMATAVVGDDRIGEGGQILGGAFEGLNLSITETIDAIGSLTASAQNLSEAEGDQIAAAAALLAAQEYTTQELMDIAQQYGDVTNYLERKAELEDEILQDAQDYASATGSKKSEAFAELEKDRAEYLKIISAEAEAQAKSDEELIAALTEKGMSDQDASELVNSQKSAEVIAAKQLTQLEIIAGELAGTPSYHQGTDHIARIRNDEAVVPPEKFSAFSDYLTRSGYGSSGGAQTIVLTLDGKVVTAVVNERNAADKRTRAA